LEFGGTLNFNRPSNNVDVEVHGGSVSGSLAAIRVTLAGSIPTVRMHSVTMTGTEFSGVPNLAPGGSVVSLRNDDTDGNHKGWKYGGIDSNYSLELDTSIFGTASPSLRLRPGHATNRLESATFEASCANGNTLTVSVKVRQSVSGDGTAHSGYTTRPRLMVRRNYMAGITSDTVLDTATASADGAWETLTGTTAAVGDDCVLEFFVDCEGTAGWVNVDDFECVAEDPNGMKFWSALHGGPWAAGRPAGGGGGSSTFNSMKPRALGAHR
jgi:hypothetical protein